MLRTVPLAMLTVAFLFGCGEEAQPQTPSRVTGEPRLTEPEDSALLGYEVYKEFCASCHDTGTDDAPVTGNPDDWNERSQSWMAVLAEHVKAGYLNMPAKGGHPELTDVAVSKAVEHMMLTTFPEKTRD
jgi:cytochrome c5